MFSHSIKILRGAIKEDRIEYERLQKSHINNNSSNELIKPMLILQNRIKTNEGSIKVLNEFSLNEIPGG